jgi:hypothetical protein
MLMDNKFLLRTDEIWVTERKLEEVTTLYSFNDYPETQTDKDLRKTYLQGRLGGTPNLIL